MSAPTLDEAWLRREVWPRFSRVLARKEIYLANHSLGRPPDRAADDVRAALEAWYRDMDGAWHLWIEGRERFRQLTASLVGVLDYKSIIPKASAGQGLRAVLNALPGKLRVLATDAEFDSLDFIMRVYRDKGSIELKTLPFERFTAEKADLIVISTVAFKSGRIFENLEGTIRAAHQHNALVLLDVYHHAGVLPLDLAALDTDFAVGGSYKYTRGGPGACWLYVHPRHHRSVTLDTGWFAKKDLFAYERPDPPQFAPGGDAWLESTPPVLAPFQALAGLELLLEMNVERVRGYNLVQKKRLASLLKVEARGIGGDHGAFLTIVDPNARQVAEQLREQGVKIDVRGEHLRLCPDFLNGDEELQRAAAIINATLK